MGLIASAAVSLAVALVVTPVLIRVAPLLGAMDRPGHLKPHERPTPYLGGLAVFLGLAAGATVAGGVFRLLVPLVVVVLIGLVDDLRDLPVGIRLIGELVAGLMAAWAVATSGPWEVLAVAALLVLLVNAVNLVDGIDALAAGVAAVSLAGIAVVTAGPAAALPLCAAASCLGFLAFNRPPARIYLGDAGSYLLGATLAVSLAAPDGVARSDRMPYLVGAAVALSLIAGPVVELVSTVIRRVIGGTRLAEGDREHLYDRLVDRGVPQALVAPCLVAGQAVFVGVAVLATAAASTGLALTLAAAVLAATALAVVQPRPRPPIVNHSDVP